MAKKIRIIPWLDTSELNKQLNQLGKKQQKIKVDIDNGDISSVDRNIQQLNKTVTNSNSVFGKLKNTIANTFSGGKIAMTGYLMVLNEINKAGKNAQQTIQDIDKAITDLSIVTNQSRESVAELVKEYNEYAKVLGSTTTQITSAADDYLRAGKSISEAQALIQDSIMLSKLGQLDSSEATEDLLATMNGFEMSIEEVEKALDAMVAIDMKAATSSGDIATALKYCASSADVAGLSFNKLAAMIGAVQDKTQQSAETIGTFFNTLLSRYRDVKINKFVDDDGESLSDVESVLNKLGIQLRDSKEEFRDFETVIDEVAQSWSSYSSVQQAAIAKAFSGTRQQNRFIALMEGYNQTLELTEVAANSAGTAIDKFNNSYLNSIEAKKNTLQASFESMVFNSDFDEIYSDILDATTALVDFIKQTNALKGVFAGLAVSSGIRFFMSAKTGATEAYIALNKFSNALKIAKQTNISTADFDKLLLLSNNLSASQMKLLLSSKSLSTAQKELILTNSGLSSEEAKLQLQTWGMVSAETGLTAATTTLGTAFKGLMATFAANPIMLVTMAVSGAVMVYQTYNQKLEETRQKNIEASEAAIEHAKSLQELYAEYNKLASIQGRTTSEEQDFKTAVEDITKALGNKAEALEGLTAGTNEYADALAKATKEELLSASVDATVGRKSAEEELQNAIWDRWKGSLITVDSNSKGNSLSEEAQKAVDIVSDALKDFETINRTWNNLSWDGATHDDPVAIFEYYNALIKAREQLVLASQDDEELLNTEIYKDMNSAINTMSESIDSYIEKLYEEEKLLYMAQNSIPNTIEEYRAMEAAMLSVAGESVDLQEKFSELLSADFANLAVDIEKVADAEKEVSGEPFSLSTYEDQIDDIQSSISTLRDALSSLNTGSLTSEGVLDLLQKFPELVPYVDMTADGFGNLSEGLNKLINSQPTELINSLYELRDAVNTEEEREQINALINSLQTLSTYGDTGMEAYATAIGATWQNTADVIEGVTTQFENLAKVQEAVANGLTMSATAAAELAQMYPEILTNAEVTADGQITLNEEVVKSILAGETAAIDAQVAQLEADKAVLTAKKEFAEAQLDMLQQVTQAEGDMSLEAAQYRINVANEVLKQAIEAGEEESEAYAEAIRVMSMNTEEFNVYVADVATDMATNMDTASASMADSVATNTTNMQKSFQALKNKVKDVAAAIKAAWSGENAGSDTIYSSGGSTKKGSISTNATKSDLNTYDFQWDPKQLSLDEFASRLELDIKGYQDAISNIDTQIDILKNLQKTFNDTANSANGGIGGHNYADKIKELEKEKDKINNALDDKKGTKKTEDTYEELFDFFERRIDVLNDALSLLKTNLDNVTGSYAKNNLIDAELGITEEKFKNYSDALNMYTQKANEALSKLPSDIAQKIQDGAVDLTDFIGKGNEDVVEAIKDYEKWADKIADCKQELAELKTAIRQLELEKFNNIMEDFTNQFDLREDGKNLISKQIDLLKEAGQLIGESFFTAQIDQSKKQLALLEEEKAQLVNQMSSAISSGRIEKGTDEWLKMVSALSDVEGNILDCKKAIEEFDNELLQLHWDIFDRIQDQFSDLNNELSNLVNLFDDSKVSGNNSGWSREAIAQLGLLSQQYELAQYRVQQYNDAINKLHSDYLAGRYSATEYMDKLSDLSSAQWDAVNSSEAMLDAIYELNEARINEEIDAIEKEIDAYKELIDAQIKALKAAKDLHDYQQSIAEKTKSITDLERQIAAMQNDDTAATVAKRKQLEEQLAEAIKDLEEVQYQHSIEAQEDALNQQYENYESERNAEIEALKASLEERESLIAQSFENVKANADIVGQEIAVIATQHGITISDAIITAWQNGEGAIASYGAVLSDQTSAFIGNIMGVENEVYALQYQANETANTLAWMFSTRADTLVGELTASYYSEQNLNAMTQALQDSLINTLERGYNISSITNALSSIASGANSVASAANSAADALARMGAAQSAANSTSYIPSASSSSSSSKSTASGIYGGGRTFAGALAANGGDAKAANKDTKDWLIKTFGYAKGGIVTKDDSNPLNNIAKAVGEDTIIAAKAGESVLTPVQTEGLLNLAPLLKDLEKTWNISSIANNPLKPEIVDRKPSVNVHYDNLITIHGDVNDTKHFLSQIEGVAENAIKKSWRDFENTRKYGMY